MSKAGWFALCIAVITVALLMAILAIGGRTKVPRRLADTSTEQGDPESMPESAGTPTRQAPPSAARSRGAVVPEPRGAPGAVWPEQPGDTPNVGGAVGAAPELDPQALPRAVPGSSDQVFRPARDAYIHGRYDEARSEARRILQTDPDNPRAWRLLGTSSCYLKDQSTVNEAFGHLRGPERKFMRHICERTGIELPAEVETPAP